MISQEVAIVPDATRRVVQDCSKNCGGTVPATIYSRTSSGVRSRKAVGLRSPPP